MEINIIYSENNESGKLYFFKAVESDMKAIDLVEKLNNSLNALDPDKEKEKIGHKYLGIYESKKIHLEDLWDLK